jgi:hypothetical protein
VLHDRGLPSMSPLDLPENVGRTEPSPAESTLAPVTPGAGRSRSQGPLVGKLADGRAKPRGPSVSVRGLIARLVPGRGPSSGPTLETEFDAAARKAYRSAVIPVSETPLVPAPLARRPIKGPMAVPLPTPEAVVPPRIGENTTRRTAPPPAPTTSPTPTPTGPSVAADGAAESTEAATAHTFAWPARPRPYAEDAVPAGSAAGEGSLASHRLHEPGETAPDSLLQVPPSVMSAADDFFDGFVRRVEGNR